MKKKKAADNTLIRLLKDSQRWSAERANTAELLASISVLSFTNQLVVMKFVVDQNPWLIMNPAIAVWARRNATRMAKLAR